MNLVAKFLTILSICCVSAFSTTHDSSSTQTTNSNDKKSLIVVSIKPLFGLVRALVKDTVDVHLLANGQQSAHTMILTGKESKKLIDATCMIWAGPTYELAMSKALKTLFNKDRLITLENAPGLKLLSKRTGDLFIPCSHEHEDHDHHHAHKDGHFWLNITNAKICVDYMCDELIRCFPDKADIFLINKNELLNDLDKLGEAIQVTLEPAKGKTALIDHDSLQYLEDAYGFVIRGVLVNDEGIPPSMKHIQTITGELDANVEEQLIRVFFFEKARHTGTASLVEKLAQPYGIKTASFDYDGSSITCAKEDEVKLFQIILMQLAKQIAAGFQPKDALPTR